MGCSHQIAKLTTTPVLSLVMPLKNKQTIELANVRKSVPRLFPIISKPNISCHTFIVSSQRSTKTKVPVFSISFIHEWRGFGMHCLVIKSVDLRSKGRGKISVAHWCLKITGKLVNRSYQFIAKLIIKLYFQSHLAAFFLCECGVFLLCSWTFYLTEL